MTNAVFSTPNYGDTKANEFYNHEKTSVDMIDRVETANTDSPRRMEAPELVRNMTIEERAHAERILVRKIDFRLMPMLVLMYILNYLDRNNIASARLAGLETDLNLTSSQYETSVSILFVGYLLMQSMTTHHFAWLVLLTFSSPIQPVSQQNWQASALSSCSHVRVGSHLCLHRCCGKLWRTRCSQIRSRFRRGCLLCEFGDERLWNEVLTQSQPGCLFFLSSWYTRKELAFRSAVLYSGSLISGAFSGLIAAGILDGLQGNLGLSAWRWLCEFSEHIVSAMKQRTNRQQSSSRVA